MQSVKKLLTQWETLIESYQTDSLIIQRDIETKIKKEWLDRDNNPLIVGEMKEFVDQSGNN